ncbi:MAG: porin family protein [Desulfobulbaceae bacterium]|nr:porin family protein [Desulfobulbaceae bacterium]
MKKTCTSLLLAAGIISMQSNVFADVNLKLNAGLGFGSYDFSVDYPDNPNIATYKSTGDIMPVSVGATIIFDSAYLDIMYSNSQTDVEIEKPPRKFDAELDRTDINLTLGTPVSDHLSAFVGYKSGTSDYNFEDGFVTSTEVNGFFVGMAYSFLMNSSSLSVSGALAGMEGEYSTGYDSANPSYDNTADYALGYSAGVKYQYNLTENWSISADAKWHLYTLDFPALSNSVPMTFEEEMTSASATLGYIF